MRSARLSQTAGVLTLGVFAINVYLGLYDESLSDNAPHFYANWVIAAVRPVAALLLLLKSRSQGIISLAGILWPVLYTLALIGDVYTRMCAGVSAESCCPSRTVAFDYLILNEANINGASGWGWKLAPVMPIDVALLVLIFLISVSAAVVIQRESRQPVGPPAISSSDPKANSALD